ncbi:MAG: hypothetical protein CL607_01550 [Anaerolineaceae bacterium]|nr:hypothetical protein [Anaerolineaceae bacterium]
MFKYSVSKFRIFIIGIAILLLQMTISQTNAQMSVPLTDATETTEIQDISNWELEHSELNAEILWQKALPLRQSTYLLQATSNFAAVTRSYNDTLYWVDLFTGEVREQRDLGIINGLGAYGDTSWVGTRYGGQSLIQIDQNGELIYFISERSLRLGTLRIMPFDNLLYVTSITSLDDTFIFDLSLMELLSSSAVSDFLGAIDADTYLSWDDETSQINLVDRTTSTVYWSYSYSYSEINFVEFVGLANNNILVNVNDERIVSLSSLEGIENWSIQTPENDAPPIIAGDMLTRLVGNSLVFYELAAGERIGAIDLQRNIDVDERRRSDPFPIAYLASSGNVVILGHQKFEEIIAIRVEPQ